VTIVSELEGTGGKYSVERLLDMRSRTRKAVHLIAAQIEVGMVEEDARAMARETLQGLGMRRGWHHIITRLGPNTTKDFMERSEPGVVLGADDIFFIDIGPIYEDTEGDAGDTFVVGNDPDHHRAKSDVRAIWETVRNHWFSEGTTGKELYQFAVDTTENLGWKLNLEPSPFGLPTFGPLRRIPCRRRVSTEPEPLGAGDRDRAPSAQVRCVLRGSPPGRPVIPAVTLGY
jgi:hypothetical protein